MANAILLGNKESELSFIIPEIVELMQELNEMGGDYATLATKTEFAKRQLKEAPFGIAAHNFGITKTVVKFKDIKKYVI